MYGKTFSHTDLMKWPCLAVKACQQHKYLIVLYTEKLLRHNINRMRGLSEGVLGAASHSWIIEICDNLLYMT